MKFRSIQFVIGLLIILTVRETAYGQTNVQRQKIKKAANSKLEIIGDSLIGEWDLVSVFSISNGDTTNRGPYWVPIFNKELATCVHFDVFHNFILYQPGVERYYGSYSLEVTESNGLDVIALKFVDGVEEFKQLHKILTADYFSGTIKSLANGILHLVDARGYEWIYRRKTK
jgi:hypothetical protein